MESVTDYWIIWSLHTFCQFLCVFVLISLFYTDTSLVIGKVVKSRSNSSPGSMEREVLKNFEEIVERSLPLEKVAHYYEECTGAAKDIVLNYVTFFEQRILVGYYTTVFVTFE